MGSAILSAGTVLDSPVTAKWKRVAFIWLTAQVTIHGYLILFFSRRRCDVESLGASLAAMPIGAGGASKI